MPSSPPQSQGALGRESSAPEGRIRVGAGDKDPAKYPYTGLPQSCRVRSRPGKGSEALLVGAPGLSQTPQQTLRGEGGAHLHTGQPPTTTMELMGYLVTFRLWMLYTRGCEVGIPAGKQAAREKRRNEERNGGGVSVQALPAPPCPPRHAHTHPQNRLPRCPRSRGSPASPGAPKCGGNTPGKVDQGPFRDRTGLGSRPAAASPPEPQQNPSAP